MNFEECYENLLIAMGEGESHTTAFPEAKREVRKGGAELEWLLEEEGLFEEYFFQVNLELTVTLSDPKL